MTVDTDTKGLGMTQKSRNRKRTFKKQQTQQKNYETASGLRIASEHVRNES